MIGKLTGVIDSVDQNHLILDVGGIGYLVHCSGRTLGRVGGVGSSAGLHVETHVREDAIVLYGFADTTERDWFRLLITVQGVGAKVAMSILTTLTPNQLAQALAAQDHKIFTEADGVGPKLANRIVSELKDKAAKLSFGLTFSPSSLSKVETSISGGAVAEALSALVNLGYKRTEAFAVVTQVAARLGSAAPVQHLIREALQELSR